MSGRDRRNVLFFGSLAISVAGHDVCNDEVAAQLERQNAFMKLRATVSAPNHKTDEAFSAVATSQPYEVHTNEASSSNTATAMHSLGAPQHLGGPLKSSQQQHFRSKFGLPRQQHRQKAAFLPVMLELSQDAVVDEVPSAEEMDRELNSLPGPSGDGLHALNNGDVRTEDYTAAKVQIEVDMSRSGSRTVPVAVQEVSLPSLNYLARHDICALVRIPLPTSAIQNAAVQEVDTAVVALLQSSGSNLDITAGVALHLYVLVRVVSLAEKVRLTQEADDALRRILDRSDLEPAALRLHLTQRGEASYGAMPLTELYRHYKLFCEHDGDTLLKHSDAIKQCLVAAPRLHEAEASFPHRWNALTEIDLRPLLLGERAFKPLLLTLAHCTNLRAIYADGNQLGDFTCGRLAALFYRHRYLAYIGLAKNAIHETGAAQLTRLLKRNLRITALPCEGNYFSDAMQQRIAEATAKNASVIANDPLNIFSPNYGYLTDLSSLPDSTQRQALRTWAMLSAAPVGDVDVMVRNLTTSSQHTIGDSPQVAMQRAKMALQARETFSLIPSAALAPLLNEVMRTVYVAMMRMLPDPLVRSLFSDMETVVKQQQEQKDAQTDEGAVQDRDGAAVGSSWLPHDAQTALGGVRTTPINAEKLFARSFLRVVVTVFRGLMLATPWKEMAVVLEGIGRMHRDLGVMAEDYWLAVHVFMAAVRISCGAESYDADHASSFLVILALAVRTTAGFDVQLQ